MAKGYRPVDRDQGFLLPPDMRDWLPGGHPVWVVIEAVCQLDLGVFHARRRTGGAGAAGYDPGMLVTLLIWAYANGVTSSRRIERLCGQDVAFRVICAGQLPDHVTIARFRQQFADTAAALFGQVLVLCARLGMGRVGTVALDGTKIAASASKEANRTEEGLVKLARELAAKHAATDAAEDARFGDRRGDDDPGDPGTRAGRVAAALASLQAERQAREAEEQARAREYLAAARAGTAQAKPPRAAAAEAARIALARETAACLARIASWEQRKAAGQSVRRRPVPPEQSCHVRKAAARLEKALARQAAWQAKQAGAAPPVRNVTDPDSRLMPVRGGGFIQGYNAQNVTSDDGLLIATRLTSDTTDTGWYETMITAARAAAAAMAAHRPPAPEPAPGQDGAAPDGDPGTGDADDAGPAEITLVLADAGYCSEHNLTCQGPDRLIATGKRRDLEKAARDGSSQQAGTGEATAKMTARLATPDGIGRYRQRGRIAETPHARIKHNMRFRQLSVRGMPRTAGEWTFTCTVHNLMLAITSGNLTTAALTRLAG